MKNITYLSALIFAILYLGSCKSKDVININTGTTLLSILKNDTVDSTIYKYDDTKRVIEIKNTYDVDYKIFYNADDKVNEVDTYKNNVLTQKDTYSYNGNTITDNATSFNNGASTGSVISTFTVNSNNQIISRNSTVAPNSNNSTFSFDASGNIVSFTSTIVSFNSTITGTSVYTYDNQKSIFANVKGNYFALNGTSTKNNILKAIHSTSRTAGIDTLLTNYTYNSDGYPQSSIATIKNPGLPTRQVTNTYRYIKL